MHAKISRHHYACEGPLKKSASNRDKVEQYVFHGEWKGSDGATYVWSKDHAAEHYIDEIEQRLALIDTTMQLIKSIVVWKETRVTARKLWCGTQCNGYLKIKGEEIEGRWVHKRLTRDRRDCMILKTRDGRSYTDTGSLFMQE